MQQFDLEAHFERQREFSLVTFGPGARAEGICDHIRKELEEIEAAPKDLMEWIDVMILAYDGAWRAGLEPEAMATLSGRNLSLPNHTDIVGSILATLPFCASNQACWLWIANLAFTALLHLGWPAEAIWHAMFAKQLKNEARKWPDWRSAPADRAIEHERAG